MSFQVAYGFFYFFVLVVNSSWSWEASHYVAVESDTGELLCGMSPPNKTVGDIGSAQDCTMSCSYECPTPCKSLNYHMNARLCDHFYYIPCSYEVQEDCINFQVKIFEFCIKSFKVEIWHDRFRIRQFLWISCHCFIEIQHKIIIRNYYEYLYNVPNRAVLISRDFRVGSNIVDSLCENDFAISMIW